MKFVINKSIYLLAIIGGLLFVSSCGDEEDSPLESVSVAFEATSLGIENGTDNITINLSFTRPTVSAHQFTIRLAESGVAYGVDYVTTPAASNGILFLDVPVGSSEASLTVTRIGDGIDENNSVTLSLEDIAGEGEAEITGNTDVVVSFSAVASSGSSINAEIGGPTEPNMVFVDLSLNSQSSAERTSWDLGFYAGNEDKVIVNYATYGMAMALDNFDMTTVDASDTVGLSAVMRIGTPGANVFIDTPDGNLNTLAIGDISSVDSENPVYIINRGGGPGTGEINLGSVDVGSTPLGWKKIRILKRGDDYLIQHADINESSFTEAMVQKNASLNFNYFDFDSNAEVTVEPAADKWDIVFSVASNVIDFGAGPGAYGFSDFVKTNRQGGTRVALVELETNEDGTVVPGQISFDEFDLNDLSNVTFSENANTIGSSWRSVFTRTALNFRYYIIEDSEGNTYKVQFLGLLNSVGERGNSSFRYELL